MTTEMSEPNTNSCYDVTSSHRRPFNTNGARVWLWPVTVTSHPPVGTQLTMRDTRSSKYYATFPVKKGKWAKIIPTTSLVIINTWPYGKSGKVY